MTARIDLAARCVDVEAVVDLSAVLAGGGAGDLRVRFADGYAYARPPEPLLEPVTDASGEEFFVLATEVAEGEAARTTVAFTREDPHGFLLSASRVSELSSPALCLRWRVPLTHREHPAVLEASDAYEFPYLEDDHGLLVAGTLFPLVVVGDLPLATAVRIEAPEGWPVLAPWPEGEGPERALVADTGQDPWLRPSSDGLRNDVIAVGAWETRQTSIGSFEATLAVAPRQEGLMEVVGRSIGRIVEHQLALFGRSPRERYLFLFGRPDLQGFGGSTKDGSMVLAVGTGVIESADAFVPHLVSHEFFHVWAASTTALPNELRWVNEGITDYFSYLVLARTGLSTHEDFAETLGEKMGEYVASPLFGQTSLEDAGGMRFFTEPEAHDYVYQGGLVIGAWLDRALRTRYGSSLDLLLRGLLNDPQLLRGDGEDPDRARFFDLVTAHADQALADELAVLVGEALELDPVLLFEGVGVAVEDRGEGARPRYRVDAQPWREHVLPD